MLFTQQAIGLIEANKVLRRKSPSGPEPDEKDAVILTERTFDWKRRPGIRVGDFIEMLDGRLMRFSHDWGDGIQVSDGGSFYFGRGGYCDFSGSLEPAIRKHKIINTGEIKMGDVWFFHHDSASAHNGVNAQIECRVYRQAVP